MARDAKQEVIAKIDAEIVAKVIEMVNAEDITEDDVVTMVKSRAYLVGLDADAPAADKPKRGRKPRKGLPVGPVAGEVADTADLKF